MAGSPDEEESGVWSHPMSGWLCSAVVVRIMTVKDAHVLISGTCGSMSLHGNKDNAIGFNIGDVPGLSG